MCPEPVPDLARIIYEGMITDADLTITSLDLIFAGDPREGVERVIHNARAVYDEILATRATVSMSSEQTRFLQDKLDRLRARLSYWKAIA